jgi:hypothetical protein
MLRSFELFQLASVRTFQQHIWTPLNVRLAMRFLSKTHIWEESCSRMDDVDSHPDVLIHKASRSFKIQTSGRWSSWPDARASYMEIVFIKSTVRTTYPMVRTRQALIWKLCAAKVRLSWRHGNTIRTWLYSGKNLCEIWKADHIVVHPDASCLPSGWLLGISSQTLIWTCSL